MKFSWPFSKPVIEHSGSASKSPVCYFFFQKQKKKKSDSYPLLLLNLFQMKASRRENSQNLPCSANWFLLWSEAGLGNGVRKIYGTWRKRFGLCLEKGSGCFQVSSYSSGEFEEAALSASSMRDPHSLCRLFIRLFLPWPSQFKMPGLAGWLGNLPS